MRHNGRHRFIREGKYIFNHFFFRPLHCSGFRSKGNHCPNFIFRDSRFPCIAAADEPQHKIDGRIQQFDKRSGKTRQSVDRQCRIVRKNFGIDNSQFFGNEFPENKGNIRKQHRYHNYHYRVHAFMAQNSQAKGFQPGCDSVGKRFRCKCTGKKTGKCNTDLHRGQKTTGIVEQSFQGCRTAGLTFSQHLSRCLTQRNDRNF